ncbi:mismatch repair protein [Martiniozyma asiatica (nom. inval.)]|nr:mismatch repair protein [Martiniozyma asiatica]
MTIQRLARDTSAAVLSTSSVQSQYSVVKELIENAIDACHGTSAPHIYIEIDDNGAGLEYLLVRDNGSGVPKTDRKLMCLNHTTSKIVTWDDLSDLQTCGFRGEALFFICQLASSVEITTKTADDSVAECWKVSSNGLLSGDVTRVPGLTGTTIKIQGLFKKFPVRMNFLRKEKRKLLSQIVDLVSSYALIYRHIRFQMKFVRVMPNGTHNATENMTFSNNVPVIQLLANILNLRNSNGLFDVNKTMIVGKDESRQYQVLLKGVFPKSTASDAITVKHAIKVLTVNNRPLDIKLNFGKGIMKLINESFAENLLITPQVWFLSLEIPQSCLDVNIEPEKSDILVQDETVFLECFKIVLLDAIAQQHGNDSENTPKVITKGKRAHIDVAELFENDDENHSDVILDALGTVVKDAKKRFTDAIGYESDDNSDDQMNSELINTTQQNKNTIIPEEINKNSISTPDESGEWLENVFETTEISSDSGQLQETNSEDIPDTQPKHNIYTSNPWLTTSISLDIHRIDNKCDSPVDNLEDTVENSYVPEIEIEGAAVDSNHSLKPNNVTKNSENSNGNIYPHDPPMIISSESNQQPENRGNDKKHGIESLTNDATHSYKHSSLGEHVIHKVNLSPKKKRKLTQISFPREIPTFSEMSQNTLGLTANCQFKYTGNIRHVFSFEDDWCEREHIPSEMIIEGVLDLYETVGYEMKAEMEDEELNMSSTGIFQLI